METQAEDQTKKLGRALSERLGERKNVFVPELLTGQRQLKHLREIVETIGPRYRECTLESYHLTGSESQRTALEQIREFANATHDNYTNGRCGLVLMGNPGTGKDHLLSALMWYAIIRWGFSVGWFNGIELYSEMRDRIGDNDSKERSIIRRMVSPNILVLSDPVPPKGEIGRYNAEILYQVLDRRYRAMKPTWVSMNTFGGDDARNKLADNLVDRLRDNSLVITCDWESYRKPQ